MKKVIRLTESDLHRIVNNSVRRILREYDMDNWMDDQFYKNGKDKDTEETMERLKLNHLQPRTPYFDEVYDYEDANPKELDFDDYHSDLYDRFLKKHGDSSKFDGLTDREMSWHYPDSSLNEAENDRLERARQKRANMTPEQKEALNKKREQYKKDKSEKSDGERKSYASRTPEQMQKMRERYKEYRKARSGK